MCQAAAGGEEEEEPEPKGIPQFWLNVLRNSEELAEHVRSAAAPLLRPHHTVSPAVRGRTNAVHSLPYQRHETISPLGPLTARRGWFIGRSAVPVLTCSTDGRTDPSR